jgi:hypothetical protein
LNTLRTVKVHLTQVALKRTAISKHLKVTVLMTTITCLSCAQNHVLLCLRLNGLYKDAGEMMPTGTSDTAHKSTAMTLTLVEMYAETSHTLLFKTVDGVLVTTHTELQLPRTLRSEKTSATPEVKAWVAHGLTPCTLTTSSRHQDKLSSGLKMTRTTTLSMMRVSNNSSKQKMV